MLRVAGRGGFRVNAGRKRGTTRAPHRARAPLNPAHPLHITLKLRAGVPSLRRRLAFAYARRCIELAQRPGFRIVHYSVMSNHLHLVVEADDREALSSGMIGLKVRLARRLNQLFERRGPLFAERYHVEVLDCPRKVHHALAYVLNNARKHAAQSGRFLPADWLDPYSSANAFDGWNGEGSPAARPELAAAQTWLLTTGWRRHGPLDPGAVPGGEAAGNQAAA